MSTQSILQFLADRASNVPLTDQQFKALQKELTTRLNTLSLDIPGSKVTVLYSGPVGATIHSGALAESMAYADSAVRTIGNTALGKFMNSEGFEKALEQALGPQSTRRDALLNQLLNGSRDANGTRIPNSLWDAQSSRFIDSTVGEVRTFTGGAAADSVFALSEVPRILNNPNITNVDNIPRDRLTQLHEQALAKGASPEAAHAKITATISAQSYIETAKIKIGIGENGKPLEYDESGKKRYDIDSHDFMHNTPGVTGHAPKTPPPMDSMVNHLNPPNHSKFDLGIKGLHDLQQNLQSDAALAGAEHAATRTGAHAALTKLGLAGDILALALLVKDANAALANGNSAQAAEIMRDGLLEMGGGIAAGAAAAAAAASALAPLVAAGPVGAALAGALALLAGVAGGLAGESIVREVLERIKKPFNQAQNTTSPLILDIDGDGVETLAESASKTYFDHDNNGFAEHSGWVAKDDGLLVRDINSNGKIDSGRELFGNNTLLSNGQFAANGFAALADLDSNADGVLNASDTVFASLRLWKDANSNGITEDGELLTLAQAGIQSISTSYTDKGTTGTEDAQGNQHRQTGNYTNAQGLSKTITDVWFNTDKAFTQDKNTVVLSDAILKLPEIAGMGNVASLRQAMARDASGALRALIERFVTETDPTVRATLVTDIIYAWAGVSHIAPLSRGSSIQDARQLEALEEFIGKEYMGIWCTGTLDPNPHSHAAPTVLKAFNTLKDYVQAQLMQQTHLAFLYNSLGLVWDEASTSIVFDVTSTVALLQTRYSTNAANTQELMSEFGRNLKAQGITGNQLLQQLQQAGDLSGQGFKLALATIAYTLVIGDSSNNHLNGTDTDDLVQGNAGDDSLNGANGNDLLVGGTGNDSLDGGYGSDIYQFNQGDGQDIISDYGDDANIDVLKLGTGLTVANTILTRNEYDLKLSWGGTDSVTLKNYFFYESNGYYRIEKITFADGTTWQLQEVADKLTYNGTTAHDSLSGLDSYANRINGGAGNDRLYGGKLADTLKGDAGEDTLTAYSGNDTLAGGTGNDSLDGGYGSDTYQFNQGDGQDIISESGDDTDTDVLKLGTGLTVANTMLTRNDYDLKLSWGGTDSVTLKNYFSYESNGYYRIEKITFADGTTWQLQEVTDKLTYNGTTAHDSLSGLDSYANRINGGAGNDRLYGGKLADTLKGDAGEDTLSGYAGNDTLAGSNGNDSLDGGTGSDTYQFNQGDGQDIISESGDDTDTDVLKLGTGLTVASTLLTRSGYDLKLSWSTSDSVTLKDYFYSESSSTYRIEQIKFADGTTWQLQEVADKLTYNGTTAHDSLSGLDSYANRINGGAGDDRLYGGRLADTLNGDAGEDTLTGYAGNDTLAGGAGNDSLDGGTGSDTYVFNQGDGQDIISDYGDDAVIDVLKLGTGLTVASTVLTRSGYDLKLSWGTSDSVTLKDYFYSEYSSTYRIEHIKFADGTIWQFQEITDKLTYNGTTAHDSLSGLDSYANRINGGAGNDRLYGGKLADTLKGDAGEDTLTAYAGNDTLAGSTGNDSLDGGTGSDTYLFNQGDGQDIISESGDDTDTDVLKLGTGLTVANTILTRDNYDLKLSWGSTDSVTLKNYFLSQSNGTYRIEKITFADGTSWQLQEVAAKLTYEGSTAHDTLYGLDNYANRINGGIGNDSISGSKLADTIKGDAGNDTMLGDAGNDTLTGGTGNDSLDGGYGSDTYQFNQGDGQDIISESGDNADTDILKLGTGLTVASTVLTRNGYDLKLSWGSTDSVTLKNYFSYDTEGYYRIEKITFADGTIWQLQEVAAKLTYEGSTAHDTLSGLDNYANRINGGIGNDRLYGGKLADTLKGDAGNDTILGDAGNDTLTGGTGNDSLDGGTGSDTYQFNQGDGQDIISDYGDDADIDVLKLGTGLTVANTVLTRSAYDLKLSWGSTDSITFKNYFLSESNGTYRIEKITFADGTIWQLQEVAAKLTYEGNTAHDTLYGLDNYANRINGGLGNDRLYGRKLADTLKGDAGNDTILGDAGNDTLAGGTGNDSLDGGSDSDTYLFNQGDGQDIISESGNSSDIDILKLGTGLTVAKTVLTRSGDDLKLSWGSTDSVILKSYFSSASDGTYRIEKITFADGTTWQLQEVATRVTLENTSDNDNLGGTAGDDSLSGGAGHDSLSTTQGNDTLAGGTGSDSLEGGTGSDTYLFNQGDGHDTVLDNDFCRLYGPSTDTDILKLGTGLTVASTVISRIDEDLKLSWGSSDSVTIKNYFMYDTGDYFIEQIEFADGTRWQTQDIANKLTYDGTAADDYMAGMRYYSNRINGGGGNDALYGGSQDDVLKGDAGDDTINGSYGNDTLAGGTGNDSLDGGYGSDTYLFNQGDGHDTILDEDWNKHYGQSTDTDTLKLGAGLTVSNTTISRNGVDLKLSWGATDSVTIKNYFMYDSGDYFIEKIEFADGTRWQTQDILDKLTYNGSDADDSMYGMRNYANRINGGGGNDSIVGASLADTLKGEAGDDTINGSYGNDTLAGGIGNDSLDGSYGSDTYLFNKGDGHDTILDEDWNKRSGQSTDTDILKLGTGLTVAGSVISRIDYDLKISWGTSDSVTIKNYFMYEAGDYFIEQIEFADGTRWQTQDIADKLTYNGSDADDYLSGMGNYANRINGGGGNDSISGSGLADTLKGEAGDDTINGSYGNDTLAGGIGNDSLDGGYGSDTYLFNKGDGHDTITDMDLEKYYGRTGDTDVLKLGTGLTVASTVLSRIGNHLKLLWGSSDSVTIQNYFSSQYGSTSYQIEQFEFADGTRWQAQDIANKLTYNGTEADDSMNGMSNYANRMNGGGGNDSILGASLADTLKGDAGDDTLNGYEGNDTLAGGTGNDSLDGGSGSDTYLFNQGDGHDTITDMDWDKYWGHTGDTDVLKLGTGLTVASTVLSRSGDHLKLAWGSSDSVTIQNYFSSQYGSTSYQIEQFEFADGTRWLAQDVADKLTYNGTEADDTLRGYYDYANRINGGGGNDSISGASLADTLKGEAGNDTLNGYEGNDTLAGGAGNDSLDGGSGSDTYQFNQGDGHDTITDMDWDKYYGRTGDTDVLKLGTGLTVASTVLSRSGDHLKLAWGSSDSVTIQNYFSSQYGSTSYQIEQFEFADGTRWLAQDIANKLTYNGTEADDTLRGYYDYANRINGGGGNDDLSGGNLADTLDGGTGNDTLNGGSGNDTYLFGRGFGIDVINDYDSSANEDVLSMGANITREQLWFRRLNNDLEVSIIGTNDRTTINNWYSGEAYRVERFVTSDRNALLQNQVDLLVQAMAAFAPPASGQAALPADYQTALKPLIAASWQPS